MIGASPAPVDDMYNETDSYHYRLIATIID